MLVDLHLQGRLPLERFVSETIGLDGVEEAFAKMERGEVLRSVVVLYMAIERVVTSGTFSLDGGDFEVDNNVWLVGDEAEVLVIDASHDHGPILDAVAGAGLMDQPEAAERRAPLVLLVLGTDASDEGSDAVLAGIAEGLAAQATGVVVAGTVSDGGPGQLGRLRADPAAAVVASVDGIDTYAGRVATIFALQRSVETPGGSFGASGADGPVPLG